MASLPQTQDGAARMMSPGLLAGFAAYTIWGFFPVYFKATDMVGALEIVAHRVVWSLPFALAILALRGQLSETWSAFRDWRTLRWLVASGVLIALNWGVYIWAIQVDRIFEAALGYYINPLIYVLVGVAVFGERLGRAQLAAVVLACIGVAWLTMAGGSFPWVALVLAGSFTAYGVIRKQVEVGAMPGLFIEVLVVIVPAALYLGWVVAEGRSPFLRGDAVLDGLLLFAGPLTVIPLFFFAFAARRVRLSTLGFLQFLGPTLQFFCGLYYGEDFTPAHAVCFAFIWTAAAVFVWGAWRAHRALPAVREA